MTRILLAASAACALALGVAHAGVPAAATSSTKLESGVATTPATDLSAQRKRTKKAKRTRARPAISSGASKAGTGGGAGGDGGSGAASGAQATTPRGNPAAPTR